jgi:ubiquinone/menaquinone biosynthesis C-methylase UbiE
MNEFDIKAREWDQNPMHWDRSKAITEKLLKTIPATHGMTALEYGAGTGITGFLLRDHLKEITMMDNSAEMVKIMNEKIRESGASNLKTVFFNLEREDWKGERFDMIVTQMVLHHVNDIENIIRKFQLMLNPGGYLAIADLYPEDGSFHGEDFTGHKGFDVDMLSVMVRQKGFINVTHQKCFVIDKKISPTNTRQFDVFLLTAEKQLELLNH